MTQKNTSKTNIPEELQLLDEWQTRLGLKDWLILLETNVDPNKIPIRDADGCVSYEEIVKAAKIQIINPEAIVSDEDTIRLRPFDFEETLVHELLHLKFCLLERGQKWDKKLQLRLMHQILDDISRALVDAKRSSKSLNEKINKD